MKFDIQPVLENDQIILSPLQKEDFEILYQAASDPKIWEQHPNKDRWKKDVFSLFFEEAIQSKGAFKIVDKATESVIGSTRLYTYNEEDNSLFMGYTFYTTAFWGSGINGTVKKILLDYVFQFVSKVCFYIGADNVRSQRAIVKIGAEKIEEKIVDYANGTSRFNFLYQISKEKWQELNTKS